MKAFIHYVLTTPVYRVIIHHMLLLVGYYYLIIDNNAWVYILN